MPCYLFIISLIISDPKSKAVPPSPARVVCPVVCKYDLRRKAPPVLPEAPLAATAAEPVAGCSHDNIPSLPAPAKRMRKTRHTPATPAKGK